MRPTRSMTGPSAPADIRPVAQQARWLPDLGRRAVLAAAAAPLGLRDSHAESARTVYLLRFNLTADGRHLAIRESEQGGPQDKGHAWGGWQIPSRAFGPNAWFEMPEPPPDEAHRTLRVHGVQLGRQREVVIDMLFARPGRRWQLALACAAWHGRRQTGIPVPFAGFLTGVPLPLPRLTGAQASAALTTMFGPGLQARAEPGGGFIACLTHDLLWQLAADGKARVIAAGGAASASAIEIGWAREQYADTRDNIEGRFVFFGRATAGLEPADPMVIGDPGGHHLLLTNARELVLDVRVGPCAIAIREETVVTSVQATTVAVRVKQGGASIAGPVPISGMVLTHQPIPALLPGAPARTVRTVLWGDPFGTGAERAEINSPIGPLLVAPPATAQTAVAGQPDVAAPPAPDATRLYVPASRPAQDATNATRFAQAASGDQGGVPSAGLFAVHDAPGGLRRLSVELALLRASLAPPDTSYSRLDFNYGDLRLHYEDGQPVLPRGFEEFPRQPASSWVWAGPTGPAAASLDLSRATLTLARDVDLAKMRLSFHDLHLRIDATGIRVEPARPSCRVLLRSDGTVEDSRPTLVAEFDPQHVLEEAVFRPDPPPLPDLALPAPNDRASVVAELEASGADVMAIRKRLRTLKAANAAFALFADEYERRARAKGLSPDYPGPFALGPDELALARAVVRDTGASSVATALTDLLAEAGRLLETGGALDQAKALRPLPTGGPLAGAMLAALYNESLLEQQRPSYAVFRTLWRDAVTAALGDHSDDPAGRTEPIPPVSSAALAEYLSETNRPAGYPAIEARAIQNVVSKRFVNAALAQDPLPDRMGARLSRPSRLAFRVNCAPPPGMEAAIAGVSGWPSAAPGSPGSGGTQYGPIPFTFEALTDWSRHEPAVPLRARKPAIRLQSGVVPPLGSRALDAGDAELLHFQHFLPGFHTIEMRLDEVRAALRTPVTELETAIEIPSRLVLSTAQDAVWLTSRQLDAPGQGAGTLAPALAASMQVLRPGPRTTPAIAQRLWTARLAVDEASPGLRAIASPDLRVMAVSFRPINGKMLLPGHAAPPRGPWAPWFIGPEQVDGNTNLPDTTDDCTPTAPVKPASTFIRWLCDRLGRRNAVPAQTLRLFRTALDANDRHQLVLLSAGWGLPVNGKRLPGGAEGDVNTPGALVANSGQIDPPAGYSLIDAVPGQAIYRPIPFAVKELSLTALGGSFLHDTTFFPAAALLDKDSRSAFDGFSIERYQHEVVLGRDIRAEVVYKGYLLPVGHRASLIKLTERVFLKTRAQGIKAILRQRMYLKVGENLKRFPAIGQPHYGRLLCAKAIRINTDRTPDLLDPTQAEPPRGGESAYGRVDLGGGPGLAFWPRTDVTPNGLVRFDVELDGATARIPLLFVDNIAAKVANSLREAAARYNSDPARRTVDMGGQTLCFAPEDLPGDTCLPTESIVLRALGRLGSPQPDWTGTMDDFSTTSVLEGADQPACYPAVESARVKLASVERLTGRSVGAVSVQYDGNYVRYGFVNTRTPGTSPPPPEQAQNIVGVFLDLREPVTLDMDRNGDRTAALARPNSTIVAFSRQKGPLGGVPKALPELDKGLGSLAADFSMPPPPKVAQTTLAMTDLAAKASADQTASVLSRFFSPDAKLLGSITLRDLIKLLQLAGLEMPGLIDALDYGAAAVEGVATDVRVHILQPLRTGLTRLLAEWLALDAKLAKLPGNRQVGAPTMAALFPDIDHELHDCLAKLDDAIATLDAVALGGKLALLYASAQRLIRDLGSLAAHPVERLEAAVGQHLQGQAAKLVTAFAQWAGLGTLATILVPVLTENPDTLARSGAEWLVTQAGLALPDFLPPPFPIPDLVAAAAAVDRATPAVVTHAADIIAKAAPVPRDLVTAVLKACILALRQPTQDSADAASHALDDYAATSLARLRTATQSAAGELATARDAATLAAAAALTRYADRLVAALADTEVGAALAAAVQQFARLVTDLHALAGVLASVPPDPAKVLPAIAALARDVLGVDAADAVAAVDALGTQAVAAAQAAFARWAALLLPPPAGMAAFRLELDACAKPLAPDLPLPQSSTGFTAGLASALGAVRELAQAVPAMRAAIRSTSIPASEANSALAALESLDDTVKTLDGLLRRLTCDVVQAMAAAGALGTAWPTGGIGDATLAAIADTVATLRQLAIDIGKGMTTATAVAGLVDLALGRLDAISTVETLLAGARRAEKTLAKTLTVVANTATALLQTAAVGSDAVLAQADATVTLVTTAAARLGLPLEPEAHHFVEALAALRAAQASWATLGPVVEASTLAGLMASRPNPTGTLTIRALFETTTYATATASLRTAESRLLACAHALHRVIAGVPASLRAALEAVVVDAGLLASLVAGSGKLLSVRNDVLRSTAEIPVLASVARQVLLAPALSGAPACAADAGPQTCDGLAGEDALLRGIATPLTDAGRHDLLRYLASWSAHKAAPQVILAAFGEKVADLARGDILAAIDVSAYRTIVEDAIAGLLPTRQTLSYDFTATILKAPTGEEIFEPKLGTEFGIAVRASTDLLHPERSHFSAAAHLGPFDVKLIGPLDALTLSFDGASFEASDTSKPRFDVKYNEFKIGPLLEFAKALQQYLSPGEGSGPYIQPLREGAGIEAGYAIDLGIISLGETSFFNVKLAVSAELPFDSRDARFRVSLGRRLAPFTMSVLPFAGSGYFAVIANAQGVVGFEASFEFGGGGAVSFGPLMAQARIQVGVYVSLMDTGNGLATTLSGTFFAGGSASIWIFHFATSLSVRLGTSGEDGAMEGEATFSFSFSLGIADYDYAVTANHKQDKIGSNDKTKSTAPGKGGSLGASAIRYAQLETVANDASAPAIAATSQVSPGSTDRVTALGAADWDVYATYFDAGLLKGLQPSWPS